jgi:hypothetical protein
MVENKTSRVGRVVWWDSGGNDLPLATVRDALKRSGLKEEYAPKAKGRNSFIRAVRKAEEQRIVRKVEETGFAISYQFTKEYLASKRLNYEYEGLIRFNKKNNTMTCDSPAIEKLVAEYQTYTANIYTPRDLTFTIQRAFGAEADLLPLRPQGAVYFIPEVHRDVIFKVDKFLSEIGGALFAMTISDQNGTKKAIYKSFLNEMGGAISKLHGEIDGLDTKEAEGGKTHGRSITMRLRKIKKYRDRVVAYESLLNEQATELREGLVKAKSRLEKRLATADA